MKISYNWLKEFVDTPVDARTLGQRITHIGLALESCVDFGDDSVLDLDVGTNRPDCLSHLGVAREVGAIYGLVLKKPHFKLKEVPRKAAEAVSITIDDADLCGRYCGRYISGVRIGPSPEWLRKRLEAVGVRSINNVADITNYVMMELGHPMHAFDADKLQGRQIIVRRGGVDEKLTTLDGVERLLNPSILVIADAKSPIALAGIMGGADTEIGPSTTNVLLESAWFNPVSIRKTARTLGMTTEASYRFERGTDIEMAGFACDRAASMIQELAGGELLSGAIDVYPRKPTPVRITLRRERIAAVLGERVDDAIVNRIFQRLELQPAQTAQGWTVEAPTFRADLANEQDLLEEIARHHGLDNFPATMPASRGFGSLLPNERRVRQLRDTLSAAGYSEICTYSFSNEQVEKRFYPDIEPVRLRNPMSEEATILRTSLIPGLLTTLQWNLNRGIRNLQMYELSKVYWNGGERRTLILGGTGSLRLASVHESAREFDFFVLKGDIEELLHGFNIPIRLTTDNIPKYYHPGRFARVGHLAMFGELHPSYAEPFKFRQRVYIAEIDIELLLGASAGRQLEQIPRYPGVKRDFSLLFDKGTQYATVHRTISDAGISELVRVEPFDRMESGSFPETKYSLSISVVYQSAERTLTDVEVETFDKKIIKRLEERLGAQLRT
ncbi:MAG TPA: phenylalanine--tRNA ligase subunit beta [Terriglobia bacterium]|nr:phenylalanine--tRNA ligase subunit beta [Terriglobia bacterium]